MNKQKLLDKTQAAKDHLDEAAFGTEEIVNLICAVSQLAEAVESLIQKVDELEAAQAYSPIPSVESLDWDDDKLF